MSSERFAVRLMIAQAALFAAETAIIHRIGPQTSLMQLGLIRATGGVLLALFFARRMGFTVLRTRQLPLQLLRGGVSLLYLWIMIYSFAHLPFADATAISYTQAAYIAVFSMLILGESIGRLRWTAATIGIFGALLIAKPSFVGWNAIYLVALFGTSLNGLSFVLNRYLQRQDSEATTMFYTNLVPLLANLPVLAMTGLPAPETAVWLPGLLIFGPVGMYLGIIAVRHAGAAMLGPYTLLRLVIALACGVVAFRELPDTLSAIGAMLILGSCLIANGPVSIRRRALVIFTSSICCWAAASRAVADRGARGRALSNIWPSKRLVKG
jgi:drug/metabolite transporter (DMT)-like permease